MRKHFARASFLQSSVNFGQGTRAATGANGANGASAWNRERDTLALAEAILPGSLSIPAADEETVRRARQVVHEFHPALVGAWDAAHSAFDTASVAWTGRPFHRLSADKQEELIARWERDPILRGPLALVALVYKFVHFDRPDVYAALGGRRNVVRGLDSPRWLAQIHAAATFPDDPIDCDVVVVGTGAGGGVVGRELAERGFAVVFLEEGEHHRRDAFDGSSVEAHRRFYRGAFSVGNTPIPIFVGRLVGGSTAINGGTCFRTPPWVLDRWCDEIGTDEFSPSAMTPHFERVERFLEVAPSPREQIGKIADLMARGCDALGWHHFAIARNAPGCDGRGFCNFGCRTDARRGTNLSYVPAALARGALLLTGARARSVLLDGERAVGVEAVAPNGRVVRVRSRAVVLAGGALPSPLLLLDQGIANRSGQVGRNLSLHPSCGFVAVADEPIRPYAHIPQGYGCDEFLREGILIMNAQPDFNVAGVVFPFVGQRLMEVIDQLDRVASFALLVSDSSPNGRVWRDVGGLPAVTYNIGGEDVRRMHQAMIRAGDMMLAAGARRLYPLLPGATPLEGEQAWGNFRQLRPGPSDFVWTSYHPMGTCKMGQDPRTSVIDADHASHDVRQLFVVDGSSVPGPLGVNPQLTIMAMATRAAGKIADRL
jgi:choline dehydrogenase-like flavoprotein